jgi:hypothetical protein
MWVRSVAISEAIHQQFAHLAENPEGMQGDEATTGILVCLEVPTPRNDYLNVLSKIIHAHLLPKLSRYAAVRVLQVNASTMRSNMGLKATGDNKWENVRKSQEFADPIVYPGIDTDSCDAILFAQYGRYVASLLSEGTTVEIPVPVLLSLCDNTTVVKGKGTRTRTVTKGILHNPAYWYTYTPSEYGIMLKDATVPPKKRLQKLTITI